MYNPRTFLEQSAKEKVYLCNMQYIYTM